MALEKEFWKHKDLSQMNEEEWEAVCDGCGKCCFQKFIEGYGKNEKLYYTRIACNLLDIKTYRCTDYEHRFEKCSECIKLEKNKIKEFVWLPENCAYRLLYEKKDLPQWHPLVSGSTESVINSGEVIQNPVHENDADDWMDFVISVE